VKYSEGRLSLSVPVGVVKSWIIRFHEPYLLRQNFFEPYPEELTDIKAFAEACEGRDLWKGE